MDSIYKKAINTPQLIKGRGEMLSRDSSYASKYMSGTPRYNALNQLQGGSVSSSYDKMLGGSGGMSGLEAASMRLADAASKRQIGEMEGKYKFGQMEQINDQIRQLMMLPDTEDNKKKIVMLQSQLSKFKV
jgi:hypothetical protein